MCQCNEEVSFQRARKKMEGGGGGSAFGGWGGGMGGQEGETNIKLFSRLQCHRQNECAPCLAK